MFQDVGRPDMGSGSAPILKTKSGKCFRKIFSRSKISVWKPCQYLPGSPQAPISPLQGGCFRYSSRALRAQVTLKLWDIARAPHWRCTVIALQLHCNCDTLHALHTVITLQLHCNCDTLHALHNEVTLQLHCNCESLHALRIVITL